MSQQRAFSRSALAPAPAAGPAPLRGEAVPAPCPPIFAALALLLAAAPAVWGTRALAQDNAEEPTAASPPAPAREQARAAPGEADARTGPAPDGIAPDGALSAPGTGPDSPASPAVPENAGTAAGTVTGTAAGTAAPTSGDSRTTITREQILAARVVKIQDALNLAPGVSASSSSVAIHGSSKVLVFLDGTPLNDPTSSYGGINLDHISLAQVDRIEVIKDAGGLHYGQDATGGVIVIHTMNAGAEAGVTGQVRVWAGNLNARHADADLMAPAGAWSLAFKAGWDSSEGFKPNNDSDRRRGGMRASREFANGISFSASADFLREEMGLSGLPDYPTPHSRQLTDNAAGTAAVKWRGFTNSMFFNRGDVRNRDPSRDLDQRLTVTEYGDSLGWEGPFGPGELALGAGWQESRAVSSEFESRRESTVHLMLAQSARLWHLPVTLRAGVRYNVNSAFKNSWNPEFSASFLRGAFGAVYKISRGVNLPSFQERYSRSSSSAPNPELGLEVAVNQSLALSYAPSDGLEMNATLFLNRLKGRISYVRPVNSGVGRYENLGKTLYRGADLGIGWKPVPQLELKGTYTYLEARDEDIGKFLTSQSRNSFTAEAVARPVESFTAAVKADYKSRTYADRENTKVMSSRILWSLRAEKSFGPVVVFLDAENVLDKKYYYVDGLLAPPRTFFMGVKYGF